MSSADELAARILEVVPPVMGTIRRHMRAARSADVTVVQFRALGFIGRHEGATLSAVADHAGLALPAMSKQIQSLVSRGFVRREPGKHDRRNISLSLTPKGRDEWQRARRATQTALARHLESLAPAERATAARTLDALERSVARRGPEVVA
ncbi:MAG: MarR family winged helix-turn-helix transcriptional regulator [Thermoplasmatota archaeon]